MKQADREARDRREGGRDRVETDRSKTIASAERLSRALERSDVAPAFRFEA